MDTYLMLFEVAMSLFWLQVCNAQLKIT